MSSASLAEKRYMKKSHSRNIGTSSTSITSAPATASDQNHSQARNEHRTKVKSIRSKHRESLPEIGTKKSSKNAKASKFELSSSTNDVDRIDENSGQFEPAVEKSTKSRSNTMNLPNSDANQRGDKILEVLKSDLSQEEANKNQAEREYNDLKRQFDELKGLIENERNNPTSEYDESISKQRYFNETLKVQVAEAKEKLQNLSQSLKTLRTCGKDCNIHMRDLIIDYNCITKGELAKEIKRFQRMEIDLKNNLDRLHWRMDCESKMYHNLIDQYHKLQMDLYYLKNLNEGSSSSKHMYL